MTWRCDHMAAGAVRSVESWHPTKDAALAHVETLVLGGTKRERILVWECNDEEGT